MMAPGQLLWERQGLHGTSLAGGTLVTGDCIVSIIAHHDWARLQDLQDAILALAVQHIHRHKLHMVLHVLQCCRCSLLE